MADINIVGGTFPNQKAQFFLSNLILRNSSGQLARYCLRLAVSSIEKTSEGKGDVTFRILLKDDSVVIATASHKIFQDIQQAPLMPAQPGDTPWATYSEKEEKKMNRRLGGWIVAIGVVTVVFISLSGGDSKSQTAMKANVNDAKIMAPVLCEQRVKDTLKSPRSAKFPFVKNVTFDGRTAVMSSYVDADNSFGAMIRTQYVCTVLYSGGKPGDLENWSITDFSVFE